MKLVTISSRRAAPLVGRRTEHPGARRVMSCRKIPKRNGQPVSSPTELEYPLLGGYGAVSCTFELVLKIGPVRVGAPPAKKVTRFYALLEALSRPEGPKRRERRGSKGLCINDICELITFR